MIKNASSLATTPLRRDAVTIMEAAYAALNTKNVVRRLVSFADNVLRIDGQSFKREEFRNLYVIGIGKCALDAAEALEEILGSVIADGIIIDVRAGLLKHLRSYVGTHPLPSEQNRTAAAAVMELAKSATEKDIILCIISGGGSALLCMPHELKCQDLVKITSALMHGGATIQEVNTVRKHLSDVQGGQLAKLAYPARLVSLVFSDVPGDDLSMVASGPTVLDTTTAEDAAKVLHKYSILDFCQLPNCELVETPKEELYFANVTNIMAVSNVVAVEAMAGAAKELGYEVVPAGHHIQGEARDIGLNLLQQAAPGRALIGAGESTVTIGAKGGIGGRNQEMTLATIPHLQAGQLFAAFTSDGEDNGKYAGALADEQSAKRAQDLGLAVEQFLAEHNATPFFQSLGDVIETGKTGANVSDLYLVLQKPVAPNA